ncbi:DUF5134 domain-containing protein, partial [Streptomyces sp. NPDC058469]
MRRARARRRGQKARSGWSARRSPHHVHHLLGTAAMVYMALAMAASPPHH